MHPFDYSLEELRSLLQRSDARTLLTEGRDDYSLFRGVGRRVGSGDLLPAGGKNNVLLLRQEAHTFSCPKTAFLVDRDLWLFSGEPAGVVGSDLIITEGYSIENDLLRDCDAESLLDDDQVASYQADLQLLIEWYCSGVTAKLANHLFDFDRPIRTIIDPVTGLLSPEATIDIAMWQPSATLIAQVSADHQRLLRGKSWLRLLSKYLAAQGRLIQHSPKAILDFGIKSGGQHSSNLINSIKAALE